MPTSEPDAINRPRLAAPGNGYPSQAGASTAVPAIEGYLGKAAFQGTHDAQQQSNGAAAPGPCARPVRACRPDAGVNSIMERCSGGCRRELLDRTLI